MTQHEINNRFSLLVSYLEKTHPVTIENLPIYNSLFQVGFDELIAEQVLLKHHFPFEVDTKGGTFLFEDTGKATFLPKSEIRESNVKFVVVSSPGHFDS